MNPVHPAYEYIDRAFDADEISEATYQCAADLLQVCDADEQEMDTTEIISEFCGMTSEELEKHRREDVNAWQEDLSKEEFVERFNVGNGMAYESQEILFAATDFDFVLTTLKKYLHNHLSAD